jgi:hypothetical protein
MPVFQWHGTVVSGQKEELRVLNDDGIGKPSCFGGSFLNEKLMLSLRFLGQRRPANVRPSR